jgi:hypothetical protein
MVSTLLQASTKRKTELVQPALRRKNSCVIDEADSRRKLTTGRKEKWGILWNRSGLPTQLPDLSRGRHRVQKPEASCVVRIMISPSKEGKVSFRA